MTTTDTTLPFVIEGVDEDGSRTVLHETYSGGEARRWLADYTRRLDDDGKAGGWSLIEVYDVRGEDAERVVFWAMDDGA